MIQFKNEYPKYESYDPIDIDFIREIPSKWEIKRLQFGASILNSNVDKKIVDGEIPVRLCNYVDVYYNHIINEDLDFMEGSATEDEIEKFKIVAGDVIITKDSESADDIGIPAFVEKDLENVVCGYHLAILKPFKEILNGKFLLYFLNSKMAQTNFELGSNGVTRFGLSRNAIKTLPVPNPPIHEQTLIARFLDQKTSQIDLLIEQKEKLLKLLAEKRTAIITQAVTKGLDPTVEMKDSGIDWLGEIPKHWSTKRFKFCLNEPLKYGANEAAESSDPVQPRFVRITDVDQNGNLRDETYRSIDIDIARPFLLEEGDLLMARSGATVGKNFMYKSNWGVACFAGYLIRARLNREIIVPEFGNLFLSSGAYWDWVNSIFIQSTIQNISAEKYANFVLAVPPKEEQQIIIEYAMNKRKQLGNIIHSITDSLINLKEYREALITAAVTGQIDVRKEIIDG